MGASVTSTIRRLSGSELIARLFVLFTHWAAGQVLDAMTLGKAAVRGDPVRGGVSHLHNQKADRV